MKQVIWTIGLVMMVLVGLFPVVSLAALTDNLQGYWQFNDNGQDSSVNNRDFSLVGSPGFGNGLFDKAIDYTGNPNQYAVRPTDDTIFDFGSNDFTVQSWVNYHSTSSEQIIIEKLRGMGAFGWTLTKLENQSLRFGCGGIPAPGWLDSSVLSIPINTWHQVIARSKDGTLSLWFNGEMVASINAPWISNSGMPLLIGQRNYVDGRDFAANCLFDETAIWTRGISDSEISYLYNNGIGNPVPEPLTLSLFSLGGLALLHRRKT
jgi:hypothetical protein